MKVRNRNHSLVYLSSVCLYYTQKNISVFTGPTQLSAVTFCFKYSQRNSPVTSAALYVILLINVHFKTEFERTHYFSVRREEQEIIELVPNIILNPGYYDDDDARTERIEPDENSNDQTTTRINNNTVVQPIRV